MTEADFPTAVALLHVESTDDVSVAVHDLSRGVSARPRPYV